MLAALPFRPAAAPSGTMAKDRDVGGPLRVADGTRSMKENLGANPYITDLQNAGKLRS